MANLPLLYFMQKLPEDRLSEVVWQAARQIVFDEGLNKSLERSLKEWQTIKIFRKC